MTRRDCDGWLLKSEREGEIEPDDLHLVIVGLIEREGRAVNGGDCLRKEPRTCLRYNAISDKVQLDQCLSLLATIEAIDRTHQ